MQWIYKRKYDLFEEQAKAAEGKDNPPAAAPADEDEGGYESCPDMTPEQLAKIANEPPPK